MKEAVLLPEGFLCSRDVCFLDLKLHIGICDFGNGATPKEYSEDKREDSHSQVNPLNILQGVDIVFGVDKEDV